MPHGHGNSSEHQPRGSNRCPTGAPEAEARRLPLRLLLGDEESLAGFVARLGERNFMQCRTTINLAREVGAPCWTFGAMQERSFDLRGLANSSGVPVDMLAAAAFPVAGDRLNRFGTGTVHRRHLTTLERRICPVCLREDGYHRRLWHLTLAASCPRHAVRLVRSCERCRGTLKWGAGDISTCACGWALRRAAEEAVDSALLGGIATICDLLGVERDGCGTAPPLAPAVADLPTEQAIDLLLHLGWFVHSTTPLPRRISSIHENLDAVLSEGARACAEWPGSFHRLLDARLADSPPRGGRYGLRHDLGAVASWVHSLPKASPLGGLMRAELAEWWKLRDRAPTRSPDLRREATDHCTLAQAVADLHIRHESLRPASAALGLGFPGGSGGSGAPLLLERSRVEAARAYLDDLVGHREAGRLLGCGRKTFGGLARCGAIASADVRRKRLPGPRKWSRRGLRQCLETIPVHGKLCGSEEVDGLITLQEAIAHLRRRGLELRTIWQAFQRGAVGPVVQLPCGEGLRGMAASRDALDALARSRQCGARR